MPTFAFVVPLISTDTRTAFRNLLASVFGYLVGLDPDAGGPTRYVLGQNNTPIQIGTDPKTQAPLYYDLAGIVGYNRNVTAQVLSELGRLNEAVRQFDYQPPFMTLPDMIADLRVKAQELGADKCWFMRPGDVLTVTSNADLISKFV